MHWTCLRKVYWKSYLLGRSNWKLESDSVVTSELCICAVSKTRQALVRIRTSEASVSGGPKLPKETSTQQEICKQTLLDVLALVIGPGVSGRKIPHLWK